MSEELVKIEYVIPQSLQEEIAEKIANEVKSGYFYSVANVVSEKVLETLRSEGFIDRVSTTVVEQIKISEDEYIQGVSNQIKDALMQTTGIIAKEVLEKVQKAVQSYGFIKIGDRY